MTFTVYTHPEMRRALDLAQADDELVIAFRGGLPDGTHLIGGDARRIVVRHIAEPPG